MSFISEVTEIVPKAKETWDTVKSILDNKIVAKRIPRIICQISALVFLFSYNHSIRLEEAAKDDSGKLAVIQRDMI